MTERFTLRRSTVQTPDTTEPRAALMGSLPARPFACNRELGRFLIIEALAVCRISCERNPSSAGMTNLEVEPPDEAIGLDHHLALQMVLGSLASFISTRRDQAGPPVMEWTSSNGGIFRWLFADGCLHAQTAEMVYRRHQALRPSAPKRAPSL